MGLYLAKAWFCFICALTNQFSRQERETISFASCLQTVKHTNLKENQQLGFYLLAPSNTTITNSYNSDSFSEVLRKQSLAHQQHVLSERHPDILKAQQLQEQIYSAHATPCSTPSYEHLSCSQPRAGWCTSYSMNWGKIYFSLQLCQRLPKRP